MSDLLKVEITIVDSEWQWMGKFNERSLKYICSIAGTFSDLDIEEEAKS